MSRTARTSQEFAQWLGETHPQVYEAVFAHGIRMGANSRPKTSLRGLGDDGGYDFTSFAEPTLQDVTVDTGNLDYVEGSSLSDVADALPLFDVSASAGGGAVTSPSGGTSSSGGITGAIGSIGQWITSPQGLSAVANLGTAVLNTVATTQVAKAQIAVIQAQAARAQAGLSPVPISYVQGTNGQMIPVYNTGSGTSMLPSSLQQAIASGVSQPVTLADGSTGYTMNSATLSSVLGSNSIWLVLGGLALIFTLIAGRSV